MTEVSIVRCERYEQALCDRAMEAVLEPLGGLDWVRPGMRIAIKANLVSAMKPEKAATTHPVLLTALTRLLRARGATVVIGDSPGGLFNGPALSHVYAATGMTQVEGAELNRNFEQREAVYPEAHVARRFTYTTWLDEADAVISFCKLKGHGMMSLSAATKNQFGVIPGTMKPEYHFRFPEPLDFAGMLVDLNSYFKPRLFLVDGVVGMDGNGPTAGNPRPMGILMAGTDCHKVDMICAKLIGLDPMAVPTLRAAANYGLISESPEDISVSGRVEDFLVPDFERIERRRSSQFENLLPGRAGVAFGRLARKALQPSPRLKKAECVGCGLCARVCPAKAIEIAEKKAKIDKSKCIRCFCCQEFCPKGAMKVHRPLPARILNR
ncbi:MAG: DUF362 domain-containing protein [Oscillospiraceae bacterium]|nr:DUF362 domain-containing protein [Oscillospiraceae bacterium]